MYLITGITGLTGRFVYEEIKKQLTNNKFRYLVRRTSDISFLKGEDIAFGDVSKQEDIENALDGINGVVHIAHIHHSNMITKACMNNGVDRVFYVNTTGMFSKHKKYAKDYIELEEKIKASNIIYTIIRPSMIYGNHRDVNIHKLIKIMDKVPAFPVIGKGEGLMQPIYAHDLAKAIVAAVVNEEQTKLKEYNIAGKEPITYKQLLKEIQKALGKKKPFIHFPYQLALLIGRVGDIIPNGLIDYEKVKRLQEDKVFDNQIAIDELGVIPRSFSEGVKLEVQALRDAKVIS
jgi:uncharacterized protein YbjT (DUF2867 family)